MYCVIVFAGFDDEKGVRRTQVENKHKAFRPPDLLLTTFLEEKQ